MIEGAVAEECTRCDADAIEPHLDPFLPSPDRRRRRGLCFAADATLEFFYDCSSPWTYLAFHRIEEVAARGGAELIWKPILVGGVFNAVNPSVYESRANPVPVKAPTSRRTSRSWARFYGVRIGSPPVFPVNSVKAMRAAFVAQEHGKISPFSRAVFEAYWGDLQDISQDDVLQRIVERVGLDWNEVTAKISTRRVQEEAARQRRRADRARRVRVADDVRRSRRHVLRQRPLPLVEHALAGRAANARPRPAATSGTEERTRCTRRRSKTSGGPTDATAIAMLATDRGARAAASR